MTGITILMDFYQHYQELFYIFFQPHWNGFIVFVLLMAFWLPLIYPFYICNANNLPLVATFTHPQGVTSRKLYKAIFHVLV